MNQTNKIIALIVAILIIALGIGSYYILKANNSNTVEENTNLNNNLNEEEVSLEEVEIC